MATEKRIYEGQGKELEQDPDETPILDRRLVTQPYDLGVINILQLIEKKTLHLRPISDRPSFQRRDVWSNKLASRLIESILLNVPIPPCYLSQNEDFELDVIDGQQRIFSIYRFATNQLKLTGLEVMVDINGKRFHDLPQKLRRKFETYTLRCVIITNDSHPEIRFDVFQRLNTNTVPLNAQELRNCIYRGSLIDLLEKLASHGPWLRILNRKEPDRRMRGEELILRFFAFQTLGLKKYRTPQKHWLNDAAKKGRDYSPKKIDKLELLWKSTIDKCLVVFDHGECFRRLPIERQTVINRALMDLTMASLAPHSLEQVKKISSSYYKNYVKIVNDSEFSDLITRAMDHKKRTKRRFEIWSERLTNGLL